MKFIRFIKSMIHLTFIINILVPFPSVSNELKTINPLHSYVRPYFPGEIKTIGETITYILEPYKYNLLFEPPAPASAAIIAAEPLPPAIISHKPIQIEELLQQLIGPEQRLVIDHQNKLLTFEAAPAIEADIFNDNNF